MTSKTSISHRNTGDTAADVSAIILCGGRGRRMGQGEKPLVRAGDRTLIEHVIDRVRPQVSTIVLSCAANAMAYEHLGYPVVADARSQAGPLAGVQAGLAAATTAQCVVCPADAPSLPADLVRRLRTAGAPLAYASTAARVQPLFMLLSRELGAALGAWLDAGGRSVRDWVAHMGGVAVEFPDEAAFENINTPDDLACWLKESS